MNDWYGAGRLKGTARRLLVAGLVNRNTCVSAGLSDCADLVTAATTAALEYGN